MDSGAFDDRPESVRPSTPVFKVLTEFDVTGFRGERSSDDTNSDAGSGGTSHVDQHLRDSCEPLELRDNGVQPGHEFDPASSGGIKPVEPAF
jgi:hypothetical protein